MEKEHMRRDHLARDRTHMANERTMLAGAILFILGIVRYSSYSRKINKR